MQRSTVRFVCSSVLAAFVGALCAFGVPPKLYIANYGNDTILRSDLAGNTFVVFDADNGIDGPFGANGLTPTPSDLLIVSDFNSRTVMKLPSGEILLGPGDGLDSPEGLALAPDQALYLADRGTHQIVRRTAEGDVSTFDTLFDAPMSLTIGGQTLFVATRAGEIFAYPNFDARDRTSLGQFGPGGNVAMLSSSDGHELLYVDDGRLSRINTVTREQVEIGDRMAFADEGLALVVDPETGDPLIFVSDFNRGNVWRVNAHTGDTQVFLTRDDGLAGPSALLILPAQTSCGSVAPCDVNCDGRVDFDDIDPFVLALADIEDYRRTYPYCDPLCQADTNHDGSIDFNDIDSFVQCLIY